MEDYGSISGVLISVVRIFDNSATGAFDHVTKHCSEFIDTRNIVAACTDGASNYTGRHTGMFTKIKADPLCSDKIIHLPDLCHRTELLLKNTLPAGLRDFIGD